MINIRCWLLETECNQYLLYIYIPLSPDEFEDITKMKGKNCNIIYWMNLSFLYAYNNFYFSRKFILYNSLNGLFGY